MITIEDIIKEFETEKTSLEKKIDCDGYNGISSVANDEKLALINRVINRLNAYKNDEYTVELAYAEGRNDGYLAGYSDGYDNGREDGYDLGSDEGYEVGYDAGYDAGSYEID